MAFMTLARAQITHLGNACSAVLRPARVMVNPFALGDVALSLGLQLAAVYVEPLPRLLRVAPLPGKVRLAAYCPPPTADCPLPTAPL